MGCTGKRTVGRHDYRAYPQARGREKELEKQLAIEIKKQSGMEYSVILSFLDYLRMLPNDNEYKRRALVNIFINAIYLYDGYFTMILNAGNRPLSIENIPLDDIEKAFENDYVGCSSNSQLVADAPPMQDNPNLRPIGQGFGFLVFIKDIEV